MKIKLLIVVVVTIVGLIALISSFFILKGPSQSEKAIQDICSTWDSFKDDAISGVLTTFEMRDRAVVLYDNGKKTNDIQFQDATRKVLASFTKADFDVDQFGEGSSFLSTACDKRK